MSAWYNYLGVPSSVNTDTSSIAGDSASDRALQQRYLGALGGNMSEEEQGTSGELQVANVLNQVLSSPSYESPAELDLQRNTTANEANTLALASGGGPGAGLRMRDAANTIASERSAGAGQEASTRAGESASAASSLGALYGDIGSRGAGLYSTDVGAAGQAAGLGQSADVSRAEIQQQNDQFNESQRTAFGRSLLAAGGSALAAGLTGGGPAAVVPTAAGAAGAAYSSSAPGYSASENAGDPGLAAPVYNPNTSSSAPGYGASQNAGPRGYTSPFEANPYSGALPSTTPANY